MTRPTYQQLQKDRRYEILAEFELDDLVDFVIACWQEKTPLRGAYYALLVVVFGGSIYVTAAQVAALSWRVLPLVAIGVLSMLTLGVVLHELLHAAAYVLLGARYIRFGADWKHYAFYAMADGFAVTWSEFVFVALTPLLVLTLCSALVGLRLGGPWSVAGMSAAITSLLMSSGDIALLNGFLGKRSGIWWTCDDRESERTIFATEHTGEHEPKDA